MKKILLFLVALTLLAAAVFFLLPEISFQSSTIDGFKPRTFSSYSRVVPTEISAVVTHVVDGDTIDVTFENGEKKRVRLVGIDTPETVDPRKKVQCYGAEASARMKVLLSGASVTLSAKPDEDMDTYGRLLRYVSLNGSDIGAEMLAGGYAISLCKVFPHPKCVEYDLLEKQAREERVGRWGVCR